jgi:hypothetical protein
MASLWNRVPVWADWIVASVAAIVLLNVNVTNAGDPLSGVGLSAGPTSPGINEGARATFYGVLVIGALVLTAAGFVLSTVAQRQSAAARLLVTTYPLVALAGLLGLLFDYRDGPVRTIQSVVYLLLVLAIVRLARIVAIVTNTQPDETPAARVEDSDSMSKS